ncbi:hypothetical protein VTI74DRAFT_9079 [Chaetomium olivicolor]
MADVPSVATPAASTRSCCCNQTAEQRLGLIAKGLEDNEEFSKKIPGLRDLLKEYIDPKLHITSVDFHRRLLHVFRDSDYDFSYQEDLKTLFPDEKDRIENFVAKDQPLGDVSRGFDMCISLGVRGHLQHLVGVDAALVLSAGIQGTAVSSMPAETHVKGLVQGSFAKHNVVVYRDIKFQNWGLDIKYKPQHTCIPNSVASIQRVVNYAKKPDMRVRFAGYRHSWASIFGQQGQITISLLNLAEATRISNFTALSKLLPEWLLCKNELQTIQVVSGTPRIKGNALVRVGCATTNEQLRRWCVGDNEYAYPLNVIMVEITAGGANAPIRHGAGCAHQTLSDLVHKHYAFPHPADRASDLVRFKDMANNWYYTEWFWFPYADACWVNYWNDPPSAVGVAEYPSPAQTFLMFLSQFTLNVLQNAAILTEFITTLGVDEAAVTLISEVAMLALPTYEPPLKTHLPDALHFQRGIQNVRALNVEVEI